MVHRRYADRFAGMHARVARAFTGLVLLLGACGGDDGVTPVAAEAVPSPIPMDAGSPGMDATSPEAGDASRDAAEAGEAGPAPLTFEGPLQFDGPVNAVLHDDGAWFVGGGFTRISSHATPNFVRLQPNGEMSPCAIDVVPRTPLAYGADSIFAVTPNGIGKFSATTCARDASFHAPASGDVATGTVYALVVAGNALYVGGVVRHTDERYPLLAKLDASSGEPDVSFASGRSFSRVGYLTGGVYTLAASSHALYVGGEFETYGGVFANHIAKLDLDTGAPDTTFSPVHSPSGFTGSGDNAPPVRALLLAGDSLYVGGTFTDYRAAPGSANGLAKLDATTGALDTTFSPPAANGFGSTWFTAVNALAAVGTSLFVGGNFDTQRGKALAAPHLVKLDLATGALDESFHPPAGHGFGLGPKPPGGGAWAVVNALAASGTSLYVGGQFRTDDGSGSNLAKLDLVTGALDEGFMPTGSTVRGVSPTGPWAYTDLRSPDNHGVVDSLLFAGGKVWVTGSFSVYGGHRANGLAKLGDRTFALDATFNPPPRETAASGFDLFGSEYVTAIAATSGSLFVGRTDSLGGYRGEPTHSALTKIDERTGALDPTFATDAWDWVNTLAVSADSLYVGGGSWSEDTSLAKHDLTYGARDPAFHPVFHKFALTALALSGTSLYVGGSSYVTNACSAEIFHLDSASGAVEATFAFTPVSSDAGAFTNCYQGVSDLGVSGSSLFAVGFFNDYRGVANAVRGIAKLDRTTGALDTTFNPPENNGFDFVDFYGYDAPRTLLIEGGALYVGGAFATYRGRAVPTGIVKLDLATGEHDATFAGAGGGFDAPRGNSWNPRTPLVYTMGLAGSTLVAGGAFTSYDGVAAKGWAALNTKTGDAK